MGIGKKQFTRKAYGAQLYSWSADANSFNKKGQPLAKYYCTAEPNSQGEDWQSGYVYNMIVVDGQQQRLAYFACDYAE